MPISGHIGETVRFTGLNLYRLDAVTCSFLSGASGKFQEFDTFIYWTVPEEAAWDYVRAFSRIRDVTGVTSQKFVPVPRISGVIPTYGDVGETITFYGQAYSGITGVYFNNILGGGITVHNNKRVSATIPAGNTNGKLRLVGASGVAVETSFNFGTTVNVTGVDPAIGLTGIPIVISGYNFIDELMFEQEDGGYLVDFGGGAGSFTLTNSIRLDGVVPAAAVTGPVSVYKNADYRYPSNVIFTVIPPPPTGVYFLPDSGVRGRSDFIKGRNFIGITGIFLTGDNLPGANLGIIPSTNKDFASNTIGFTVPEYLIPGKFDCKLMASGGTFYGEDLFEVLGPPDITSLSQIIGNVSEVVTMFGVNLYSRISKIWANSTSSQPLPIDEWSSDNTYIKFHFINDTIKLNTLIVNNTAGQDETGFYTILQPPVIINVGHPSGDTGSGSGGFGDQVMAQGFNLASLDIIEFAGQEVPFTLVGETGLYFQVPHGATDSVVKGISYRGPIYSEDIFYVYPPTGLISGFGPSPTYRGNELYITGSGLNTITGIGFSGYSGIYWLQTFDYQQPNTINLEVPFAAYSGYIYMRNRSGQWQSATKLEVFTPPFITGITPISGIFQDTITISGYNFDMGSYGQVEFYFPGVNNTYVRGLNTSITNNILATTKVPREIRKGVPYISGVYGFTTSLNSSGTSFVPIPTVTGVSGVTTTGTYWGGRILIDAVNAYDADISQIIASGIASNLYVNILESDTDASWDYSHIGDTNTGFTRISGNINGRATGLVTIGLQALDISGVRLTPTQIGSKTIFISGVNSIISGFAPLSGSNHVITFSGNNFQYITGAQFTGVGATGFFTGIGAFDDHTITGMAPEFGNNYTGIFTLLSTQANTGYHTLYHHVAKPYIDRTNPTQIALGVPFTITGSRLQWVSGVYLENTFGERHLITGLVPTSDSAIAGIVGNQIDANLAGSWQFVAINAGGMAYGSIVRAISYNDAQSNQVDKVDLFTHYLNSLYPFE